MKSRNILIVGDSLGLPRINLPYSQTWPFLLSSKLTNYHFVLKLQRALTSKIINSGVSEDWLEFYCPQYVILQLGIVDCSPRYIKNGGLLMKFLSLLPQILKSFFWILIKKSFKRSSKNADINIKDFQNNIEKYISRCEDIGVERIFIIKIAKSGSSMVKQNPNILDQIDSYNKIIEKISYEKNNYTIISSLEKANDNYFLEDGYHLNEYGNKQVFQEIVKHFE